MQSEAVKEAVKAVRYFKSYNDRIYPPDGHSKQTAYQVMNDHVDVILKALEAAQSPASAVEVVTLHWQEIDKPWNGTNTRAFTGAPVDILLNANARIPDVYFCYYDKEFKTCGTDVPVILAGDPFNKVTHWMPNVHPVDGLKIAPLKSPEGV